MEYCPIVGNTLHRDAAYRTKKNTKNTSVITQYRERKYFLKLAINTFKESAVQISAGSLL